jgi:hypothetical protein
LGDLLVEAGLLTPTQLGEALRHQAQVGGRLGTNLVELGFVDERTLASALAKQLSIPSVTQAQLEKIPANLIQLIPGPLAARLRVVPMRLDSGRLWLAMSDPTDKDAQDEISRLTKNPVRAMVAPDMLIQSALEKYYRVQPVSRRRTATPVPAEYQAPIAPAPVYEEVALDDADVATGYLDDEAPPAVAAPSQANLPALLTQMANAATDEAVLDAVLRYLAPSAAKLCVLVLRKGQLVAWRGFNIDVAAASRIPVALDDLALFKAALDAGQSFVGRMESWTLGGLAKPLGAVGESLGLVMPMRLHQKAVGAILGLDASLDVMRRRGELDKLSTKLDQALQIQLLKKSLLTP